MRSRVILIVSLLALSLVFQTTLLRTVQAQGVTRVYVSPVTTGGPLYSVGQNFNVGVRLDLAAGQTIASSDVKLNYSGWGLSGLVIKAVSVDLSQNLYAGRNNIVSTDCIDGIQQAPYYTPCSDYNNGEVEVGQILQGNGNVFTGPLYGVLFNVAFNVRGSGVSLLSIPVALLFNPGYGTPNGYFVQYVPLAGVFSNTGIAAFFNYEPVTPPTILPGGNVSFDARDSFNANNPSIMIIGYAWSFGDGSSGSGNQTFHVFRAPGNYSVQLTVTDSRGSTGVLVRVVNVLRALGSLLFTVKNTFGNVLLHAVVQLFNSSSGPRVYNMSTYPSGMVLFTGLLPGDYYVNVSGFRLVSQSKTEHIIAGWQVMDTIYVTQIIPPNNNNSGPPDYSSLIYLGILLAGVAVFGSVLVWRRVRKRREAGESGAV